MEGKKEENSVRESFEFFKEANIEVMFFWDVMPHSFVNRYEYIVSEETFPLIFRIDDMLKK
jgi:hypothetical protein